MYIGTCINIYYIYYSRMRKLGRGGRRFDPFPPPPGMWKEDDMIMATVQLEYEVRFDCPP
jgi:hypothetical protein